MARTDSQTAEIERVLERFDFKYVSLVMHLIGWSWDLTARAPSPFKIREVAESLLDEAARQGPPDGCCATGGLLAKWIRDDDDKPRLRLSFVLEEADSSP